MPIITGNNTSNTTITSAYVQVPVGTTAQRPTGANGLIRYNSTLDLPEYYNATAATWQPSMTCPVRNPRRA